MARKSTIKLLLINESDNEGERLISLFRNAGRVARAHRAESVEELYTLLEKKTWDLIIANDKHPEISIEQCLGQLSKLNIELPVIAICDKDTQSVLDTGICDVVGSEDDQRLIFAAFRELNHLENHRKLEQVQNKLKEAEERCELLLAQSQDAIAYCADGMIISANPLFCAKFGYDSADDLDCLPIIDLIDSADQDKIKSSLKAQAANVEDETPHNTELAFTGVRQDQETFCAAMQLSNAVFDDDPCIQLLIRDQMAGGGAISQQAEPGSSGATYSQELLLNQLRASAQQASSGTATYTLFFISIDRFTAFRSAWGITRAFSIVLNIADFIRQKAPEPSIFGQFCDDGLVLILEQTGTEKALEFAKSLCKNLEDHIIEIDSQSVQCTASIGIVALDRQCPQDPDVLIEQAFSCCEQLRSKADNDGIGNGAQLYIPTRKVKAFGDAQNDEELDHTLEEALEDGQFVLTYQPVVSLRGTSGDHYEVQAAQVNEQGELIPPSQFLKNLAFSQPNTRLDRWIIIEATKQLGAQQRMRPDTRLFIDLTTNALLDESLMAWLGVALKAAGIKPESLIFQFSEADVSACLKPAIQFARGLKELGCRLSVSEFGQISDPYKTLKHVDADYAKISPHFTHDLQSGGDTQMLKAMVSSINEHKAQAIISSVENASALAVLWQLGVDYIQGGYLAAPATDMNYEFTDIA